MIQYSIDPISDLTLEEATKIKEDIQKSLEVLLQSFTKELQGDLENLNNVIEFKNRQGE